MSLRVCGMDKGYFTLRPQQSLQNTQDFCQTPASWICGAESRVVQFHCGEWVWRAYSHQGGKLRYTNRGSWLVLAKMGPVAYQIQRHPQADPEIVHVDKLMPHYPDFGQRLYSWIKTDHPTQYRDQEAQTLKTVLQDQPVAMVDIPPQVSDPTLVPEPAEPHPDAPSPA